MGEYKKHKALHPKKWPGSKYADHAPGNRELQAALRGIFKSKSAAEWIAFGDEANTPLASVNTPENIINAP